MNNLTLDPPNRLLMKEIQMTRVHKDAFFSIIEDNLPGNVKLLCN